MRRVVWMALLLGAVARAQSIDQFRLDHLAAKAKESTELTLDGAALQLAGSQMTGKGDDATAKSLLAGLKGIVIRHYEFEREGQFSPGDIEQVRRIFRGPGWTRVVGVNSKADRELLEIFTKLQGGKGAGMAMIATERREFTVVYFDGIVDLSRLSELGARFGLSGTTNTKKGKK